MSDEAIIDTELLFVNAIADLNEMHMRLLARMRHEVVPTGMIPTGMSPTRISREDPGLADGIYALFGTLESHGLIVRRMPAMRMSGPEQATTGSPHWANNCSCA